MAAMGLVIATFVLGGGAYAGALPSSIHHLLFYVTIAVQVYSLRIEGHVLLANERLMVSINERVAD